MPKIIFKMMWTRIKDGNNIIAVVKNLAKDGSFYWVITEFEPRRDRLTNQILSYTAFRRAAPQEAIDTMSVIYKKLLDLEKTGGMEASEEYLREFLDKKDINYDEYVCTLVGNRGVFKTFFQSMKSMFSS